MSEYLNQKTLVVVLIIVYLIFGIIVNMLLIRPAAYNMTNFRNKEILARIIFWPLYWGFACNDEQTIFNIFERSDFCE